MTPNINEELEMAIKKGQKTQAEKLLKEGAVVKNYWTLDYLVTHRDNPKFLNMLESNGVNLCLNGEVLLFKSALTKKIKNFLYLLEKTEIDSNCVYMSFINMVASNKKDLQSIETFLSPICSKMSLEMYEKGISKLGFKLQESDQAYLFSLFLRSRPKIYDRKVFSI